MKNSFNSAVQKTLIKIQGGGHYWNRHYSKDIQMENRYMKIYSMSLIIMEMQIKTTM